MADTGVEVGTAYVTVLPSTRGFHTALAAEVNKSGAAAGQSAGGMFAGSFSKALPAIGGAMAGVFAASKVKEFLGDSITAASDLNESLSKSTVVFGANAAAVEKWSQTSATALLMSQQQALEAAGTYGNLFQAFGIGQRKAEEMSTSLVQLAADLASFNNTSVDDAILALRSGLSGETEPLKRFGVALTDARLKQEALNMGIYDGVGILDAGQRAQAAYALILKDTSLAQGDVARTADGWANTTRAVEAAVTNAQAKIGGKFLDSLQELSKTLGGPQGVAGDIEQLGNGASGLIEQMLGLADAIARVNSEAAKQQKQDEFSQDRWRQGVQLIPIVGSYLAGLSVANENSTRTSADLAAQFSYQQYEAYRVAESTDAAATSAQRYDEYLKSMTDRVVEAATGVSTLQAALDRFQGKTSVRQAQSSVRSQWADLQTMGERVARGKGKNRHQVQLAFEPTVIGGKLGTSGTGQEARDWLTQLGVNYSNFARARSDAGQPILAAQALATGQKRIADQLREWGVSNPVATARSYLPERRAFESAAQAKRDRNNGVGVTDESSKLGTTTIYQINVAGNIDAGSPQAVGAYARQAARAAAGSRLPHGAVSAGR